ncbi:MAG TPA: RagB/SusD family nutrient uptake outer membrane protein [Puia sp.]|nr:RagB/SusD family nutrient uptake outer membrane protein [Puia sp.]
MNKNLFYIAAACCISAAACTKKLDRLPTNDITPDKAYSTPAGYKQGLAKVYSAFANTGNTGGTGSPDIPTQIIADEGNSDFLRLYFNLQELTTDEGAWTWQNDAGIQGLHEMSWSSINPIIDGLYYRSFFQITLCNEFIRQSAPAVVDGKHFSSQTVDSISHYRAEARFLRAYQYWVLMDLFANPPFATENDKIASFIPKQISRADLFKYVESELKGAADSGLVAPHSNEYGRADQAAAWALLARLYLNAQVYTGTARYTDAITYCNKIVAAGYTLHPDYTQLMLADNNLNTDENIFTIVYDGTYIQNYGGTTYLIHGPANIPGSITGCNGSWTGLRLTQQSVQLFPNYSGTTDHRAQFWQTGQTLAMTDMYTATAGFSTFKFRNVTRSGGPAPDRDPAGNFSDIDFPLFRLGEIYLIYAESVLRGGTGGDAATALNYINALRTRAYGSASGNIAAGQLTTDYILDERGRELYYECFRRTDLIRYGKFTTGAYLWAWKGGVASGTAVADKYNLFPIPSTDLSSNPNLHQNPGY